MRTDIHKDFELILEEVASFLSVEPQESMELRLFWLKSRRL